MRNNKVVEHLHDPHQLEQLYRSDEDTFSSLLTEAILAAPDSDILKTWEARINYQQTPKNFGQGKNLLIAIALSILTLGAIKIPIFSADIPFLSWLTAEWFYPRFTAMISIGALIAYFVLSKRPSFTIIFAIFLALVIATSMMFFMPSYKNSSTITMSYIHLPFFLISVLALSFVGEQWRVHEKRLMFIRYIGEISILSILMLIGGIVLTSITFLLFGTINVSIGDWYLNNVVVLGIVSAPIISTFIYESVLNRKIKMASIISNVFAPLFLITTVVYLFAMFYQNANPFTDREFLITFNGLLVIVWGITVYSVAGRGVKSTSKMVDTVNVLLLTVSIIINAIAVLAIGYRLIGLGITPNRIVVFGSNIIVFIHILIILKTYAADLYRKNGADIIKAISIYMPMYTVWSIFVTFILPFAYSFK